MTVSIKYVMLSLVSMSLNTFICISVTNFRVQVSDITGICFRHNLFYSSVTSFDLWRSRVKLSEKDRASCSMLSLVLHCLPSHSWPSMYNILIPVEGSMAEAAVTSGKLAAGFKPGGRKLCCG